MAREEGSGQQGQAGGVHVGVDITQSTNCLLQQKMRHKQAPPCKPKNSF
jgi:hypothetical protein